MRYYKVPDETIRRLPLYLRLLLFSAQEGQQRISSKDMADYLGVNSWQIRKDFSYFGGFGTRGVGYDVKELINEISKILKLNVKHRAALVGFGKLGSALLGYHGFTRYGFDIVAVFDTDPKKIGKKIKNNIVIEDVSKLKMLKKRNISIAISAIPREVAQETADSLVKAGVKAVLNFSPCHINVPKKVKIIDIDIATDLARLPYYISTG